MTQDDLLYRFLLRVFAIAAELGNVRAACRAMGIHPSTFYRWKRQLDRHGRRSCGPGNGAHRGWPTRPACWWSSGWWPSPWAIPGDEVRVERADGSSVGFVVERTEQFDKQRFPTDDVYYPTLKPGLRLVTCGGTFDASWGHYRSDIIVFAAAGA